MSFSLSESDLLELGYPPTSSQLILTSHDLDTQKTERDDAGEPEVSVYSDFQCIIDTDLDYLNQEEITMQNAYDLYYNPDTPRSDTARSDTPRPVIRSPEFTIGYHVPVYHFPEYVDFDLDDFSIYSNTEHSQEEGNNNVEKESDTTEVCTNNTKDIPDDSQISGSGSQVPEAPLSNSQVASSHSSQDDSLRCQYGSQHSNCECPCHDQGCSQQPPKFLRQHSSPAALMIPFERQLSLSNCEASGHTDSTSQKSPKLSK